jgi:parvulin-like peptidyl-prolyl isomerase
MLKSFEDAAFSLDVGQVSDPVKTSNGWHLIELLELGTGDNAAKIHARHILMSSSLDKRKPKKSVEDQAWAIARDHLEKALARLNAGEAFRSVARDMSEAPGSERSGGVSAGVIDWPTPHEIAVLNGQSYGMKPKVSEPGGTSLYWTTEYRMEAPAFPGQARPITKVHRAVDRAFFSAEKHGGEAGADEAAEDFRKEFSRRIKEISDLDISKDPRSPVLLEEFRKLVREQSDAPSASHGGAVGLFREPEEVKRHGLEWLKRLGKLRTGERSEPFRSQDGFHILLLERVETASFDEAWEKAAEDLLVTTSYDRRGASE